VFKRHQLKRTQFGKSILFFIIFFILLLSGQFAVAADRGFGDGFTSVDDIRNASGIADRDFPEFIKSVVNLVLGLVAIVAAAVLIYGGFLYITDLGEGDRAKKAKKLILYALIGLVVIGVSAIVVNVVINTVVIG